MLRYFEPFETPVWLKRYHCPDCRAVHALRPRPYPQGFRYPFLVILLCLITKVRTTHWHEAVTRQLQQYWWKRMYRAASTHATLPISTLTGLFGWLLRFVLCDVLLL